MKNLYLLENINDSNLKKKINTDDSEIITFDYFSHNILSAHQIKHRNMIVKIRDKNLENFFISGNPIKMSSYKDPSYRKKSPELDEHRNKILKEFNIQLNTKTSG